MRSLISAFLCFLALSGRTQLVFKVLAGYNRVNFHTSHVSYPPFFQSYSPVSSFQAGLGFEKKLYRNLHIEAALLYFGSGTKMYALETATSIPGSSNYIVR